MVGGGSILGGGGAAIKSIQRGSIAVTGATSVAVVVTAVDMANSVLRLLGQTYNLSTDGSDKVCGRIALTDSTHITGSVNTSPGAQTCTLEYELIEYWPGFIKSIQRGTISGATATITSVDTTKSWVDNLGFNTSSGTVLNQTTARVTLTNATTVTHTSTGATPVVGYQVVETF